MEAAPGSSGSRTRPGRTTGGTHAASGRARRRRRQQIGCRASPAAGGSVGRSRELLRARLGPLPVEAPQAAVGQHAELDAAVGEHIRAGQVAEHLGRGDLALVERALAALTARSSGRSQRLLSTMATPWRNARSLLGSALAAPLRVHVGEQQHVGHVGAAVPSGARLDVPSVAVPAQGLEDAEDQVLLGLRLAGLCRGGEAVERGDQCGAQARR